MPLVACPQCATNLRVPDGVAGAIRCPKCQTTFPAAAPKPKPAFEVVEDAPPPKPVAKAAVPAKPAVPLPAKPAPRPAPPSQSTTEPQFEVVDDAPVKPARRAAARVNDEDDDDRPRKKKRRDEDEDERPRNRKRRDEDDDDEDDQPRKTKRRDEDNEDEDEDDEDWAESGNKKVAGAGSAKTGMLMVSIAFWIQMGVFAIMAVFMLIGWLGGYIPFSMMMIPGILGMGATVVAVVGFAFCIGGPPKSRPLAIAGTAVAGLHIVLAFVIANNPGAGLFSERTPQESALFTKTARILRLAKSTESGNAYADSGAREKAKNFEQLQKDHKDDIYAINYYNSKLDNDNRSDVSKSQRGGEITITGGSITSSSKLAPDDMRWADVATMLPFVHQFISVTAYYNNSFGDYALGLLGGVMELVQLILALLLIMSVSKAVRGGGAHGKAKIGLIGIGAATGLSLLLALIITVVVEGAKSDLRKGSDDLFSTSFLTKIAGSLSTISSAEALGRFVIFALCAAMLLMPALAALQASSEAARRARR